jgi:uroporphyrinogen-III synthase
VQYKQNNQVNTLLSSPLQGQRILITRPLEQAQIWSDYLQALGAEILLCPMISIAQLPKSIPQLHTYLKNLASFDWLVVSSSNSVQILIKELSVLNLEPALALADIKLAAVGPQTAKLLKQASQKEVLIPPVYQAQSLAQMLTEKGIQGQSVLYLRAQEARLELAQGLSAAGALLSEIAVYETLAPSQIEIKHLLLNLEKKCLDILIFASASAVSQFAKVIPLALWEKAAPHCKVAVLGPITAQAALKQLGKVDIQAPQANLESLAKAMEESIS